MVPSNSLTTTPTQITASNLMLYGVLAQPGSNDGAGNLGGFTPSGVIFSTSGASGGDHVYYLSLNISSTPAATQLSNLSMASSGANQQCSGGLAELSTLTNAASGFAVLHLAGADGTCGTSDDQFMLVTAGTPAGGSPTTLPITGGYSFLNTFYSSPNGALAGILASDGVGNLVFFASQAFTSPTTLLPAASGQSYRLLFGTTAYAFVAVSSGTYPSTVTKVYRVGGNGAIGGALYTSQTGGTLGFSTAYDTSNIYFTDSSLSQINVVQLAESGASAGVVLYSDSLGAPGTSQTVIAPLASTGTQLVLDTYQISLSTGTFSSGALQTLAVGAAGGTPATVASISGGYFPQQSAVLQGSQLYATQQMISGSGSSAANAFTEQVLGLNGSVVSSSANAALIGTTTTTGLSLATGYRSSTVDSLLLAQGIAATDGSYGGATLYSGTLSGTNTPLQNGSGTNVTVATGYSAYLYGYTPTIGEGLAEPGASAPTGSVAGNYVFDVSKNVLVLLNLK